jgi:hypothetical protein
MTYISVGPAYNSRNSNKLAAWLGSVIKDSLGLKIDARTQGAEPREPAITKLPAQIKATAMQGTMQQEVQHNETKQTIFNVRVQ